VRTHTDIASMEGACEAGRRAANAILEREGATSRAEVWPLVEPPQFERWKRLDADLYRRGRPHLFESVGFRRALDAVELLRLVSSITGLAAIDSWLDRFKLTHVVEGLIAGFGAAGYGGTVSARTRWQAARSGRGPG